jgi:hypothetical protein
VASYVFEKALKSHRGIALPTNGFLQSVRN